MCYCVLCASIVWDLILGHAAPHSPFGFLQLSRLEPCSCCRIPTGANIWGFFRPWLAPPFVPWFKPTGAVPSGVHLLRFITRNLQFISLRYNNYNIHGQGYCMEQLQKRIGRTLLECMCDSGPPAWFGCFGYSPACHRWVRCALTVELDHLEKLR